MANDPFILDQGGWVLGVMASLKAAFGTDTEAQMHSHIKFSKRPRFGQAHTEIDRMTEEARILTEKLGRPSSTGMADKTDEEFKSIIKDLP